MYMHLIVFIAASIASATIASTVLATAGTPSPTKNQRDPNPNPNLRPSSSPSPFSPNRATLAQTFKGQNLSSADSVQSNLTQTSSQKVVRVRDSGEQSGSGSGLGSEEDGLRLFLAAHLSLLAALFAQQGATATAAATVTLTSGGKHGQSRYSIGRSDLPTFQV